jgi:hypothetical protein
LPLVFEPGGGPGYLNEFSKKSEMTLMFLSGAWRKMIHEKT